MKKDRGRPGGPVAKPKQFGEVNVFSDVPNVELLQKSDHESDSDEDDDDVELPGSDDVDQEELVPDDCGNEDEAEEDSDDDMNNTEDDSDVDTSIAGDEEEDMNDSDEAETDSENEEMESEEEDDDDDDGEASDSSAEDSGSKEKANGKKRKMVDFDANLLSADTSLRALKRFAEAKSEQPSLDENDGILSNEDFRKIKDLQVIYKYAKERSCCSFVHVIDVFCVCNTIGKEGSKTCIGSKRIQGSRF